MQWLRVPGGQPTAALEALCKRLVSGQSTLTPAPKKSPERPVVQRPQEPRARGAFPEFPREEAGQRIRFWAQVIGWLFQAAWAAFNRLPKWLRVIVYLWVAVMLLSRGCAPPSHHADRITAEQARKLAQISDSSPQNWSKEDIANFVAQVSKAIPGAAQDATGGRNALLAIPFSAPPGDSAAQMVARSVFAQVYGRVALARHGHVGLTEPPPSISSASADDLGRANHSEYVIYGAVEGPSNAEALYVNVLKVVDGSTVWSQSYPIAGADPAQIAAEVVSNLPSAEDE